MCFLRAVSCGFVDILFPSCLRRTDVRYSQSLTRAARSCAWSRLQNLTPFGYEHRMQTLPIDALLPETVESLRRAPNLVIEAPPGAGKTTRVPPAVLDACVAGRGDVLVLEPRRLAARMAARREIGRAHV